MKAVPFFGVVDQFAGVEQIMLPKKFAFGSVGALDDSGHFASVRGKPSDDI